MNKKENICVDYIIECESIKNYGYLLRISNMNNYVCQNSKNLPKLNTLSLITFNNSGQNNLTASDTINSISLESQIAEILNVDTDIAKIIVREHIEFSKRFYPTMDVLNELYDENIIIADNSGIVITHFNN